jgi:hypothetical protein
MRPAGARSSLNEILCGYLITLVAAGAVDDGPDAIDRRADTCTGKKIPGYEADAVFLLASLPGENANIVSGLAEPAYDMTAECARATCN